MLQFVQEYWGIIAVIVFVAIYALYDFERFKKRIIALIFVAEERAEQYALEKGTEKFEWWIGNPFLDKFIPNIKLHS